MDGQPSTSSTDTPSPARPRMRRARRPAPAPVLPRRMQDAAEEHRCGNDAYRLGDWASAERFYTAALGKLGPEENLTGPDERTAAAVYLANRAASRLMLGSPVMALADCVSALQLDKTAARARMRLASCLQQLGAFVAAEVVLQPLLLKATDSEDGDIDSSWVRSEARNRAVAAGAADAAVTRAEALLASCRMAIVRGDVKHAAGDVLARGFAWMHDVTSAEARRRADGESDAETDLSSLDPPTSMEHITARAEEARALLLSAASAAPAAERILVAQAQVAILLRHHAEAVELVGRPNSGGDAYRAALLGSAPQLIGDGAAGVFDPRDAAREAIPRDAPPCWRAALGALAAYLHGDLDVCTVTCADPALERATNQCGAASVFADIAARCEELQAGKERGNDAFRDRRHAEALAAYTACLSGDSPFPVPANVAAVALCNRAAVHHATGDRIGALLDVALAAALDASYEKPYRRMAALYAELKLPVQRSAALERLAEVQRATLKGLEERADAAEDDDVAWDAAHLASRRLEDTVLELGKARREAAAAESRRTDDLAGLTAEHAGADLRAVLGVSAGASPAEVRKRYKEGALRAHPDKATRAAVGVLRMAVWGTEADAAVAGAPEAARELGEAAFKLLKAASAVLTDPQLTHAYEQREREEDWGFWGGGGGRSGGFAGSEGRRYSDFYW